MILDTNGLSGVAEGAASLEPVLRQAAEVAVPVIVLGEYRYGIRQSRHRQRYEQWLMDSLRYFRVLSVDEETAIRYAGIRSELKSAGTPIPANDAWIAALCRQHSLPLVSRDRNFDLVRGLRRIGW
ncbi:MAG: type II toxin-antitoxin system VapC family toxin [Candidatus Acidiferrales bacterium]